MTNLHQLQNGQRAQIDSLLGEYDEVARLSELGLCSGAEITVIRRGSPCIVEVDGGKLCLRPASGTAIYVSPILQ